jgi:glutaredoxin
MNAIVWSSVGCTWCEKAKALLKSKGIAYEERKIGSGYQKEDLLEAVPGARTVPQIFLDGEYIGGFDQLAIRLAETKPSP